MLSIVSIRIRSTHPSCFNLDGLVEGYGGLPNLGVPLCNCWLFSQSWNFADHFEQKYILPVLMEICSHDLVPSRRWFISLLASRWCYCSGNHFCRVHYVDMKHEFAFVVQWKPIDCWVCKRVSYKSPLYYVIYSFSCLVFFPFFYHTTTAPWAHLILSQNPWSS